MAQLKTLTFGDAKLSFDQAFGHRSFSMITFGVLQRKNDYDMNHLSNSESRESVCIFYMIYIQIYIDLIFDIQAFFQKYLHHNLPKTK